MTRRVAVVGLGRIGWSMGTDLRRPKPASHVEAWQRLPDRAELVAVCDLDSTVTGPPDVPLYEDLAVMLEVRKPEIVTIATPPETHRTLVEMCAAWPGVRAIICEKPMAVTTAEASAMIDACRQHDVLLFIDHSRHFDPVIRHAAQILPDKIGRLLMVTGRYTGGLYNSGSHLVDLVRMFAGEISWVLAARAHDQGADPNYDVLLQSATGVPISLHGLEAEYSTFSLECYGQKGRLILDEFGYRTAWSRVAPCPWFTGYDQLHTDHALTQMRSFLEPMARHVLDCLDDPQMTPVSTGEDGLACMVILEAIRKGTPHRIRP